jgi:hypothetical protein
MNLMMTLMVIETSVQYLHLTRLITREDYIKFARRESTKTYNIMNNQDSRLRNEIMKILQRNSKFGLP